VSIDMKIRNGFVSNSSSASFVVKYITEKRTIENGSIVDHEEVKLLTDEESKKLIDYGFKFSCERDPHVLYGELYCDDCSSGYGKHLEYCCRYPEFVGELYLRFFISCNEDEVIKFLIDNNIPFVGLKDSDESLIVYKRNMSEVLLLKNEGVAYIWSRMQKSDTYFDEPIEDEYDYYNKCEKSYKTANYIPTKFFTEDPTLTGECDYHEN
jgi:hypothetical protein